MSFTGIDDPYEPPKHPEITLKTISMGPEINAGLILDHLVQKGFVKKAREPVSWVALGRSWLVALKCER